MNDVYKHNMFMLFLVLICVI